METGRWRDVERVLDIALDSDPASWTSILDEQCIADPELRGEVERLLGRYSAARHYLEAPPSAAAASLLAENRAARAIREAERTGSALAGRYRIVRELGRGGMATVYLAHDECQDHDVALKVLSAELAAGVGRGRFLREIAIAARLDHPRILAVLDSGDVDGVLFYVMPYMEGETLRARLAPGKALALADALPIMRDVAAALAYAHSRGVVHRDVKPDNIMLAGRHAYVADFGVAKAIRDAAGEAARVSSTGISLGTPAYMAPEQALADPDVDHRADLYALGVVAYETLTGRLPFAGREGREMLFAHVNDEPEDIANREPFHPDLADLVMTCLRKKPSERWQSADEVVRRLETLMTSVS
jgi:serine/threonine protein kinase